ncbi:MAG TPA: metallophosphoesterase [Gemmataceae bacterium]|jgi:Icc-related predicted phosphoesterase|nr:metallophosphoesterase [Gemmataceae bacterium]
MKLLLFSDLHCNLAAAQKLLDRAGGADVAVGAGDFGQVRTRTDACMGILKQMPCPAVVVPGNAESVEELRAACAGWDRVHVLHGDGATVAGVPFWGLGGGVPVTPFGSWSYDFTEDEATRLLRDFPAGGILVTHSPPKGCLDVDGNGTSRGSTAVRDLILAKRPALVVCGHIHASGGRTETFHGTPVVNAGPGGVVFDLSDPGA